MKKSKPIGDQALARKASRNMIDAVFTMVDAYSKKHKDSITSEEILYTFLEQFVSVLVYQELAKVRDKKLTPTEQNKIAKKNFAAIKLAIQDSISEGFGTGASAFSGLLLEYYCLVKSIPEGKTKVPS